MNRVHRGGRYADPSDMPPALRAARALRVPLTLALVLVLSYTSVRFAPQGTYVSAWWPAVGVAAALVVLSPAERWRWLLPATAVVTAAGNLLGGREVVTSLFLGVANAAEVLVVALLLGARLRRPQIRSVEDLCRFLVAIAAASVTVGLLAAVVVSARSDAPFFATWWTVQAAHGAALTIILALVLVGNAPAGADAPPRWALPLQVLGLAATLTAALRFGDEFPLMFLPLPFLVWGAFVLAPRLLAAQVLVIGLVITVLTDLQLGAFAAADLSHQAEQTLVQLYLAVLVSATLPLSVALGQRRAALLEEQRVGEELQQQRDFTNAVLDSTLSTAIIGTDATGTVTYFSRGAELLLGATADDVVGRSLPSLFHDAREVAARAAALGVDPGFEAFVHVVRTTGHAERRDWTYVRADGATLVVSMTVNAMRDARGRVVGYVAVAEDVTERRRAESALREALGAEQEAVERLKELDRIKSDFVSSVSHELRTPLTAVLGFTQLLGNGTTGPLTSGQQKIVGRMDRSGRRLLNLIEDLLTLSRIEAGRTDPVGEETVDMRTVLENAVEATERLLDDRDIEFEVTIGDARTTLVAGDHDQLERVLVNLVSNAIKFTPDGGRVALTLTVTDRDVLVTVADTGVGIPSAEQGRLFERFFRASTATQAAIQGTGLGLAIVHSIVDAHGGGIQVTSEEGIGTTFVVSLPLAA